MKELIKNQIKKILFNKITLILLKTSLYAWFVCFILLIIPSCDESSNIRSEQPSTLIVSYHDTPTGISVQKVDGCEYIYCETGHGCAITHKANCGNHLNDTLK